MLVAHPDDAGTQNDLGSTYLQLGRPDDAADRFEQAITIDDELAQGHYNLAALHLAEGRHADAADGVRSMLSRLEQAMGR